MHTFIKWTLRASIYLFVMGFLVTIGTGIDKVHVADGIGAIFVGSLILGTLFYFIEEKWIPWRKAKLREKISKIFDAKVLSEDSLYFKLGLVEVYVRIEYSLNVSQHNNSELIVFHLPQNQSSYLIDRHTIEYKESSYLGIPTYVIFQSSSWNLKRAKIKLEKKFN